MAAWKWPLLSRALTRWGSAPSSTSVADSTKERVSTRISFSFWLRRSALGCMKLSNRRVTAVMSFLLGVAITSIVIGSKLDSQPQEETSLGVAGVPCTYASLLPLYWSLIINNLRE